MADYQQSTKANIAIKQLLGKSQTDNGKSQANEAEGIFFNVSSDYTFTQSIDPTPSSAVTAGVAEFVSGVLTGDTTSNGFGYFALYPVGHPKAGQRIKNAIPPSYGVGYEAVVSGASVTLSAGDDRAWLYQYQSGIYFQEIKSGGTYSAVGDPKFIYLYVYKGTTLTTSLANIVSGSGKMTTLNKKITALVTTTGVTGNGNLACLDTVSGNTISGSPIEVRVNGIKVDCGNGSLNDICFFAAYAGSTQTFSNARAIGAEVKYDALYWRDTAPYQLDINDEIDFIYMVSSGL